MFAFAKKLVTSIEQSAETIISQPSAYDSYFQSAQGASFGLRVLAVKPDSLASKLGLESWFDYIISVNNHQLPVMHGNGYTTFDHLNFLIEISNNVGRSVEFDVWNAKGGVLRRISVPIEAFDNDINDQLEEVSINEDSTQPQIIKGFLNKFNKIGITVQLSNLQTSTYVWHILNTHPNSPGYKAGLFPYGDYIIGAQDGLLATGGEDLLSRVIHSYYTRSATKGDCSIVLYVYNHDYDIVRPVTITLDLNWGGKGLLGCDVGYGYLHRIPEQIGKFESKEDEDKDTIFDNSNFISAASLTQPLAPANIPVQSFPTQSLQNIAPPPQHKKKTKRYGPTAGLDDYLNEELEKSRAADVNYNPTKVANLPPPPKS